MDSRKEENPRWLDNSIQFPRLLSEIMATQDLDWKALAESMDLDISEVEELFDRAQADWDRIIHGYTPQKES